MTNLIKKLAEKKLFHWYLALFGGLIMGLSWYKPFTFLIFVGLIPLLILQQNALENKKAKFYWQVCLFLAVWNISVYWWLWNSMSVGMIFLVLIPNTFLMSTPIWAWHLSRKFSTNRFNYIALLVYWVSFEHFHQGWDLAWSWLNLGNIFGVTPQWVQWYEYTGTFGGTFWVLIVNILFYEAFITKKYKVGFALTVLVLPLLYSYYIYFSYEENGKTTEIVVVQPNFDVYNQRTVRNPVTGNPAEDYIPYEEQISIYIDLVKKNTTDSTSFVLFPESSLGNSHVQEDVFFQYAAMQRLYDEIVKDKNIHLVAGISTVLFYYTPEEMTPTSKKGSKGDKDYAYDRFNAALHLSNEEKPAFYHKSKLVVGAENNPFQSMFGGAFGTFIFKDLMGSLGTQEKRDVFIDRNGIKIAPAICWESVFGEFMGGFAKEGANILTLITNDGWWADSAGPRQHLAFSSLRALETRRSLARAANTGISCFIDQRGKILIQSEYGERIALRHSLHTNEKITFYTKYGDYLGDLAMFVAFFIAIATLVRRRLDK